MKITLVLLAFFTLSAWNIGNVPTIGNASSHQVRGKSTDSFENWNTESKNTRHSTPAYQIKKIVLDAGHGGKDPGCLGASEYEKNNALAIVLKLGAYITANYPEVEVIYTRETDVFIELKERAAIANRNNADLFISVHCNALGNHSTHGTETYVLGLHKAKHNLEVAKRENASIYLEDDYKKNYEGYDPDSPEAHIIGSVWQSAYLEQSILFAGFVQSYAHAVAQRNDRGVKQAGFLVLRETAMPAVLIETGYLTNSDEESYLASDEGREQVATAILRAFGDYKSKMEGQSTGEKLEKTVVKPEKNKSNPVVVKDDQEKTAQKPKPKPGTKSKATEEKTKNAPQKEKPAAPVCRIWLMSWHKKMDKSVGKLGLLDNIQEEFVENQYHYYTNSFANCEEAEKMLPEIKNLGFKTATVVSK